MITGIFDTHAHYDDEAFDLDRDELLSAMPQKGVSLIMNAGSDIESSKHAVALSEKYDFMYCAVGYHPIDGINAPVNTIDILSELAKHKKVKAIGEIGLDYHYDDTPRNVQLQLFEAQLKLAKRLDLPVIVHDRDAHADVLAMLKKHRPRGVVHCFSGSVESAKEIVSLGMYIGLGGAVTFKNAKTPPAVAAYLPADRLLLETDCPYMSPVPLRGKRCDSSMIAYTAEKIAQLRGEEVQALVDRCNKNGRELFGI